MPRLLVVDDEPTIRDSLSIILEDRGYDVDTAPGAEEGWRLVDQHNYDLILTDLLMPKIDGFEFIKKIREKYRNKIPVIILTAHGTVEIASLAINEGINDFIIKPFEVKTVTNAVSYALQKKIKSINTGKPVPATAEDDHSFEKKFFGLSSLDEIGKEARDTSEMDEIGDTMFEQVRVALKPDRGLLVFYNKEQKNIKYQRLCTADQLAEGGPSSVDNGILEWVGKSGKPLLINDMANDKQYKASFYGMLNSGSLLAMPFIRQNRLLGTIVLYRQAGVSSFNQDDLKCLSVLSCITAVAVENLEIYDEMKSYFTGTIRALITTVETKDFFTFGHSARVAKYTLMIAEQLNLPEMDKRRLEYIALLHDIGKIGIPEDILKKTAPLTDEEWAVLRTHPELGENIVRSIHFLPEGASVIRHHHEHYNGAGYPDGLKGEEIPFFARIISIADAFDAMSSGRPYRESIGKEKAMLELLACKDTQFDPALVDLFIRALEQRPDRTA